MPNIVGLPLEVQHQILSYLVTTSGPSHIHAALRTCKRLYNVGLPLSVHTFRNAVFGFDDEHRFAIRNKQFLRYIHVTKPELANHVKAVILGSHDETLNESSWEKGSDDSELSDEEYEVYESLVQETLDGFTRICHDLISDFEDFGDKLMDDLYDGRASAQVDLLLLSCPNIETLCVVVNPESSVPVLPGLISKLSLKLHAADQPRPQNLPLLKLKNMYHELDYFDDYELRRFFQQASGFFCLPGLRSCELVGATGGNEAAAEWKVLAPRSSPIEELILRKCYIRKEFLISLIGSCKALKAFECVKGKFSCETIGDHILAGDVMEAILPHAPSLEYLCLVLDDDWASYWDDTPERHLMGPKLRKMERLKTLVAGMPMLTGLNTEGEKDGYSRPIPSKIEGAPRLAECLPDSLEHLQIHYCQGSILDQVNELLEVIENGYRFKNLKRIRLVFLDDNISEDEVRLSLASPRRRSVELDIYFQDFYNHSYDRVLFYHTDHMKYICSRIFAEDLRSQWLKNRLTDMSHLPNNGDIYEIPGIKPLKWEALKD